MNISFENKVALVTGAASGLGLAAAKAFAESGAAVALADWNEEAAQSAAKEIASKGHKTIAIGCDVSDDAQVEAMVAQTVAAFGRVDAAYNNAGVQNVLAAMYVRGYNGVKSRWYQAALRQKAGKITAAGMTKDVIFELKPMIGERAHAATVKIMLPKTARDRPFEQTTLKPNRKWAGC